MSDTRDEAWEQYRVLPLNSDRFTQDQIEQDAFIAGWDAAKADLPDRETAVEAVVNALGGEAHIDPHPAGVAVDVVFALFRGEEPK